MPRKNLLSFKSKKEPQLYDDLIQQTMHIAFSNIFDVIYYDDSQVTLKPYQEIPAHSLQAVAQITEITDKHGSRKINVKMHNKIKALNTLLKILKTEVNIDNIFQVLTELSDADIQILINKIKTSL